MQTSKSDFKGSTAATVFVVVYMENKDGWGASVRVDREGVFKTLEGAKSTLLEGYPEEERNLRCAGDCFTYPNGPNNMANIYEVFLPDTYLEALCEAEGLPGDIVRAAKDAFHDREIKETHQLALKGLNPKPGHLIIDVAPFLAA